MAMPRTKIAVHFAASLSLPPPSFVSDPVQRPGFLQNFQLGHFSVSL
jgi:hypothetical protein